MNEINKYFTISNVSKQLNTGDSKNSLDYFTTNNVLIENLGSDTGISAMSISDMTGIPRATIIRKCQYLVKVFKRSFND